VIPTYFVYSNDDSQSQQHSHRKKSDAAGVSRSVSNDFYYEDVDNELVINIAQEKSTPRIATVFNNYHDFKAVSPAARDLEESEIEVEDTNQNQNRVEKESDAALLRWSKELTPKRQEFSALEFAQKSDNKFTPSPVPDYTNPPPGNVYLCLAHVRTYLPTL